MLVVLALVWHKFQPVKMRMWTDLSECICECVFILVSLTSFDCVWANTCPLGDAKVNSWLRCLPLSPSQFSFSHWLIFLFFVALSRLLVLDRLCLLSSMYHSSAAPTSTPYITNTGVQLLWCYSIAFVRLQRTWLNPPCDGRQIGDFLKCSHWKGKKKIVGKRRQKHLCSCELVFLFGIILSPQ